MVKSGSFGILSIALVCLGSGRAEFGLSRIVLSLSKGSNLKRGRSVPAHTFSFLHQAAPAKFPSLTVLICTSRTEAKGIGKMKETLAVRIAFLIVVALGAGKAAGGEWEQQVKFTAGRSGSEYFGEEVFIRGDRALVGAYADDNCRGAAYMYERGPSGWVRVARLTASDRHGSDYFGSALSVDGDCALVSAPGHSGYTGATYVFDRIGAEWTQTAFLGASDRKDGDVFGKSLSLSGDYALIGAYGNSDAGRNSGSAYIFERGVSRWTEVQKLVAPDAAEGDWFGRFVSLSGDYALVGAPFDYGVGEESGSAYVFERGASEWEYVTKLTASDAAGGDKFGWSVSLSGDYALIGAYGSGDAGAAYMFERRQSGWTQVDKLVADDAAPNDRFGYSASLSGDCALIGAYADDDAGDVSGSAYVFERRAAGWTQADKLTASDAAPGDWFGYSVSVDDGQAVIGAYGDDGRGILYAGAAYIFTPEPGTLSLLMLGGLAMLRRRRSCGGRAI